MLTHAVVPRLEGWFSLGGEDYDVVVATVLNLVRNIEDLPFTDSLASGDALTLRKRVERAFGALPREFQLLDRDALRPEAVRFYNFRGLLLSAAEGAFSILAPDETLAAHVGGEDHLTLSGFAGGWNPAEALQRVRELDSELEEQLSWAVSLRLGYLSPRIETAGTGLTAEAILFLPALRQGAGASVLDEAAEEAPAGRSGRTAPISIPRERVEIRPVAAGAFQESSLYRVRCRARFPEQEEETLALLEETVNRLVHYEREARNRLLDEHRLTVGDAVNRARGLLSSALTLTQEEALAQAALVRLGTVCGFFESPGAAAATMLLYAAHDDAVALLGEEGEVSPDVRRARLIGSFLESRT